jgi:L-malate glycosyltransferase
MKVLLFAPSKSIHTQKWALHYIKRGIEVKVVTFEEHYSESNAKSVETIVLPKLLPGKLTYFLNAISLKKVINRYKPDILHAHFASSYGLVASLIRNKKSSFFVSVWGTDIYKFPKQSKINEILIKYTLNKADYVFSTSYAMASETKKYTANNIKVIPFGVDINKFMPLEDIKEKRSNLTIGIVKSLEDNYGISDLINAFSKIRLMHKDINLLIVGDGPKRNEYELLVSEKGLNELVTFTGKIPNYDVPKYINAMDIFVVPSREIESFGVAAVEAMACGVPVIVTDIGGLPEVVKDGKTGIVVPKRNEEMLIEKINFLIENKETRDKYGINGVKHVKRHYNWEDNADEMVKFYTEFLKGLS